MKISNSEFKKIKILLQNLKRLAKFLRNKGPEFYFMIQLDLISESFSSVSM